jgi:hypothetical protein
VGEAMKIKIAITIGLLLVFSYSEVRGADWVYLGTSTSRTKLYYDQESTTRPEIDIVRTWIKIELPDQIQIIALEEINCRTKMSRILSETKYNKVGDAQTASNPDAKWRYIVPESMIEDLHSKVCY